MTVARKPGHRGEHGVSRKPLRREGRIASAEPVCSCAFFCAFVHTRPRVQRAPGFPCALCLSEGETETQSSGAIAPRGRIRFLAVIASSAPAFGRPSWMKQNGGWWLVHDIEQ